MWQVTWVLRDKTLGEDARSEALVSTCTDGRVLQVLYLFCSPSKHPSLSPLQWSIRKGLESSLLMKLKRAVLPKPPQTKKQAKASKQAVQAVPQGPADTMISQHAPGLGLDFNPTDPNM